MAGKSTGIGMPARDAQVPCGTLRNLVGYHLRRASVHDLQGAVAALEPMDLRMVPMSVLMMIVEEPGISAAEICRALLLQRANIVSVLAELERRGLFLREVDPSDNRIQRLFPTAKGEAEAHEALTRITEHEDRMLAALSARERTELRRLLAKVWQDDGGD